MIDLLKNIFRLIFERRSTDNQISLSETFKRAFHNVGLFYYDIAVDESNQKIKIYDAPDNIEVVGREPFTQSYFNKVKAIVRNHLPKDYRLIPQDVMKLESSDDKKCLVLEFESVESKRIDGVKVISKDFKIPLMKEVDWNISKQPHALVTGVTGSGKSMFINYLFQQFQNLHSEIYTIDSKYADLYMLSKKHLDSDKYADNVEQGLELLTKLNQRLTLRQKILTHKQKIGLDAYQDDMRPIVLFFDELAAFKEELSTKKERDAFMSSLKNLVLKGRSAGITMVLSLQKPLAEDIPTSVRDQMNFKLVLGKNTSEDTKKLVFGIKDKNVVVTEEVEKVDDWQVETLGRHDGWYQLPNMNQPFRVFETPDLTNLKV